MMSRHRPNKPKLLELRDRILDDRPLDVRESGRRDSGCHVEDRIKLRLVAKDSNRSKSTCSACRDYLRSGLPIAEAQRDVIEALLDHTLPKATAENHPSSLAQQV